MTTAGEEIEPNDIGLPKKNPEVKNNKMVEEGPVKDHKPVEVSKEQIPEGKANKEIPKPEVAEVKKVEVKEAKAKEAEKNGRTREMAKDAKLKEVKPKDAAKEVKPKEATKDIKPKEVPKEARPKEAVKDPKPRVAVEEVKPKEAVKEAEAKEAKPKEEAKEEPKDIKPDKETKPEKQTEEETSSEETKAASYGPKQVTKKSIRMETWGMLDSANVILFPMPCTFRIPRFKGEVEAVKRLSELDVFINANVIKVSLDKAHECVRLQVIEAGKELIAGAPGLREAVFLHMKPPVEPNKAAVKMASSRAGINHLGTALDFNSETKAELVIIGSVIVDRQGRRIGKGEGFSDLEYSLLMKLGGIAKDAPVVTIVHDLQICDSLPEEIFQPYDVPVDYIITPTQVIHIQNRLPRPNLIWNLLSNRRVNNIPIIKQLLDREQTNGMKIELKEEDSDVEDRRFPRLQFRRRKFSRKRREMSAPERRGPQRSQQQREGSAPPIPHTTKTFRRKMRNREDSARGDSNRSEAPLSDTVSEGQRKQQRPPMRRMRKYGKSKFPVDFSVRINGLTSGTRIRDLKAALIERGVRPRDISWRGAKGVALLHFSKGKSTPETPVAVDDIVASLQGLKIKVIGADGPGTDLNVEPAKPITRIEVIEIAKV